MKTCCDCDEEKSFTEFHKEKSKDGYKRRCKPCQRAFLQNYRDTHKDVVNAGQARYVERNREVIRERGKQWAKDNRHVGKAWRQRNLEKARESTRKYMAANPHVKAAWREKNASLIKTVKMAWRQRHPHKVTADTRKRQATQLRATPPWADHKAIEQYYLIAKYLSDEMGIAFHVDHVVPLQGGIVCGLHAQTNMSISLGAWNCSKGAKWWPDMPESTQLKLAA
jgi:hypothetical protein